MPINPRDRPPGRRIRREDLNRDDLADGLDFTRGRRRDAVYGSKEAYLQEKDEVAAYFKTLLGKIVAFPYVTVARLIRKRR